MISDYGPDLNHRLSIFGPCGGTRRHPSVRCTNRNPRHGRIVRRECAVLWSRHAEDGPNFGPAGPLDLVDEFMQGGLSAGFGAVFEDRPDVVADLCEVARCRDGDGIAGELLVEVAVPVSHVDEPAAVTADSGRAWSSGRLPLRRRRGTA